MREQGVEVLGGAWSQGSNLKDIARRAPPGVELAASFYSTRENSPGPDTARIGSLTSLS